MDEMQGEDISSEYATPSDELVSDLPFPPRTPPAVSMLRIRPTGFAVRALAAEYARKCTELDAISAGDRAQDAKVQALRQDLDGILEEQDAYKKGWQAQLRQARGGREALAQDIVHGLDVFHGRPLHTQNMTTVARALLEDETIWSAFELAYPGDAVEPNPLTQSPIFAWVPSIVRDLLTAVWGFLKRPRGSTAPTPACKSAAQQAAEAVLEATRYLNLGNLDIRSAAFLPHALPDQRDAQMKKTRSIRAACLMDDLKIGSQEAQFFVFASKLCSDTPRGPAEQIIDLSDHIAVLASPNPFDRTPMPGSSIVRLLTEADLVPQIFQEDIFAAAMKLCASDA
jgi:hypothetical protein